VTDAEREALWIDVLPAQTEQLALAETGGQCQDIERFQAIVSDRRDHPARLVRSERLNLHLLDARAADKLGNIPRDKIPAHRLRECRPEHGSEVLDGLRSQA